MSGHRLPILGLVLDVSAAVARWGGGLVPGARVRGAAAEGARGAGAAAVPGWTTGAVRSAGRPAGVDVLAALHAAGEVDVTELTYCPRERRTRPHAVAADGRARCWSCGCETDGI
ncbi:hypothetical protein B0E38_04730 [Streptomyces sp. 111WW2]|uniref:hypothetical protein n=1 Tax=Streptomyces sp. 111WW2 TaxID=1945515 RepID=UPI000D0C8C9B|nr:hypothetical protein [Streptomyces sp. 111WW2]PSK52404.1 hypothetical protein B0E38_04730 [Streptomyces sp. 111WW2]